MLMNPTETSALVVKAHCLTLTVWVPKGSLVSPAPSFLFHSVHLQLSRLLAAQTDREQCRIINRLLQYSLHLRCKEQGFYVPTDGFSIRGGGATQPLCSLKMNGDKLSALIITHTRTWVWSTLCNSDNSRHLERHMQWDGGGGERRHTITNHQHKVGDK